MPATTFSPVSGSLCIVDLVCGTTDVVPARWCVGRRSHSRTRWCSSVSAGLTGPGASPGCDLVTELSVKPS